MVHNVTYIVFGIFDALAVMLLILKLYMIPVDDNKYKLLSFTIFIAFFSFFMRVVLTIPTFDLPMQYLLFVLFLRVVLKIKVHLGSFMAGAGICAYAILQMGVYYTYSFFDIMSVGVLKENDGLLLYVFQVSSIIITLSISLVLTRFNAGFTFIIRPPHNFFSKENYFSNRNMILIVGSLVSFLTTLATILLLYEAKPLALLIASVIAFAISFYFSSWSDKDDIRIAIAAYREKNKGI